MDKWNSRKLIAAAVGFSTATGLLVFGHIDSSQWAWMSSITLGGYLGGQGLTDALSGLRRS